MQSLFFNNKEDDTTDQKRHNIMQGRIERRRERDDVGRGRGRAESRRGEP